MTRSVKERCEWIVQEAINILKDKLAYGALKVEKEVHFQLQLALVIQMLSDLSKANPSEQFSIELEKNFNDAAGGFFEGKNKTILDIWVCLEDRNLDQSHRIGMELKYFKKENQGEPPRRADVFKDIFNLENCLSLNLMDNCYMLVLTDHSHYYDPTVPISANTSDFDLRDGKTYLAGKMLKYKTGKTEVPYVPPFTLSGTYNFNWDKILRNLQILVVPFH